MSKTRFWNIWRGIKDRCLNPNSHARKWYSGRGITVCKEWLDFRGFYNDMYPSYFDTATIERVDVNKGYNQQNCRWVPKSEQSSNTRKNVHITYKGKTMILKDWAKELGINYNTLYNRLNAYKMPINKAFIAEKRYAGAPMGNHNNPPKRFLIDLLVN